MARVTEEKEASIRQNSLIAGFKFGFGFFVAWLLGLLLVGAVTYITTLLLKR